MARTITVIAPDSRDDGFAEVVAALNAELEERGILGDTDAMDMSFTTCMIDAVSKLGGQIDWRDEDYYVALDGAPLSQIVPA